MRRNQKKPLRLLVCALLVLALQGCGSQGPPSVLLIMDGPPLFIAVDVAGKPMHGFLDRKAMAGAGRVLLYDQQNAVTCTGEMDAPATDKGRLYVTLTCSDGREMALGLRNLGPDQGMGVGRLRDTGERLTLFYHPCEDEARRRLARVKTDIAKGETARVEMTKQTEKK